MRLFELVFRGTVRGMVVFAVLAGILGILGILVFSITRTSDTLSMYQAISYVISETNLFRKIVFGTAVAWLIILVMNSILRLFLILRWCHRNNAPVERILNLDKTELKKLML